MSTNLAEMPMVGQQDFNDQSAFARQEVIVEAFRKNNLPKGFYLDEQGLWFKPEPTSNNESPSSIYICSALYVIAIVRDHANENFARLLEFRDLDGHKHTWVMPMQLLASDGVEYRKELLSRGLIIAPGNKPRQHLTEYIQLCQPVERARCVLQTGWFENCFIFPSDMVGISQKEQILYQSLSSNQFGFGSWGILEEWQKMAQLCRGNSRLIFSVCVAFAAPLLSLLGEESGGFHFRGQSSTGKSTALRVASSVWGGFDYLQSWRATSNGLEGVAAAHNDSLLCLDEIEEVAPSEVGGVAYMLANGSGKTRSDRHGVARRKASWRLLFLSAGEISIAEHLQQVGKKVRAGQEIRIIDIPADTGKFGIFEYLHGYENGDAFSKHLCKVCKEHYGLAAREFLKCVVNEKEDVRSLAKELMISLQNRYLPKKASGQVSRAFHRFVLVAVAGEIATCYGITRWEVGDAADAVMKCFNDWLQARGGVGMQEDAAALAQVRKFFELHGSSRFGACHMSDFELKTINRAGFSRHTEQGLEYLVLPQVFKTEVCAGLDHTLVAKICIQHGLLIPDSNGKATRPERIPALGTGTTRVYRFSTKVLTEGLGVTGETGETA